jgi:hypothetical protein
MSISFMTFVVVSSVLCLFLYTLKNEYSYISSSHSHLYLLNSSYVSNKCNISGCTKDFDNNYKVKMEQDSIMIVAYVAIMIRIVFPNVNHIV